MNAKLLKNLFETWGVHVISEKVLAIWRAQHRKYHSLSHLRDLFDQIEALDGISLREREILQLAAVFHDIVYDPRSNRNEEASAEFFLQSVADPSDPDVQQIAEIILDSKHHVPRSALSKIFCDMDMSIVQAPYEKLLEWEDGIRHEYSFLALAEYKERRLAFLRSMVAKYPGNADALNRLIQFISETAVNGDDCCDGCDCCDDALTSSVMT